MPSCDGLKFSSFNAKCDQLDYRCCNREVCGNNNSNNLDHSCLPDDLAGALLVVSLMPHKSDIFNIQNVKNRDVVVHFIKELNRVRDIMENFAENTCNDDGCDDSVLSKQYFLDYASRLNEMPELSDDAVSTKDTLVQSGYTGLDYVDLEKVSFLFSQSSPGPEQALQLLKVSVTKYANIYDYDVYYGGSCLTLVKKSLELNPDTHEISGVDSIVLDFDHGDSSFVNVNLNLGSLSNQFEEVGQRKAKVDSVVSFLKSKNHSGKSFVVNGAFGDVDYDVPQLLFRGDGLIPELAQTLSKRHITSLNPVPSDFPCDSCDPLYEVLELMFRTSHAEHVPYSWLLQYLRLKNCKKCNLYKLFTNNCSSR